MDISAIRKFIFLLPFIALLILISGLSYAQDRTMMQGFYWDATPGGVWYDSLAHHSSTLELAGFDGIWLPPPSKGAAGGFDVGYTPYDYYDLGEYDNQPGGGSGVPTRYGTREQLENAIAQLQGGGIEIYMDIVVNHRSGGQLEPNEFSEWYTDRNGGSLFSPDGDSTFTAFPYVLENGSGRISWDVGDGNDFFIPNNVNNPDNTDDFFADNQLEGFHQMYVNNFGYQNAIHDGAGNTLPLGDSLKVWGDWLTSELGIDGYRFDFVKGIHPEYLKNWVDYESNAGKFHVHELFDGDIGRLQTYLDMVDGTEKDPAVFDFNIRFAYKEWSDNFENYDIRNLHDRGLYNNGVDYDQIVPFIDNHDTDRTDYQGEINQEGHDPVVNQKDLMYAHMLTHPGYPQVWWRDYFYDGFRDDINLLTAIRNQFASGDHHILTAREGDDAPDWPGNQSNDEQQVYVMERDGVDDETGLIVAINKDQEFDINVWVTNERHDWRDRDLHDITGNVSDTIRVEEDGRVQIQTKANSYSVYVPTDYDFELDTGLDLQAVTGLRDDYFPDETISSGVQLESSSTLSQDFTIEYTITDDQENEVHSQELESNIQAGDQRSFEFDNFQLDEIGTYTATATLVEPGNNNSQTVSETFEIIDPETATPVRINGRLNDPGYRFLSNRINTNEGFGEQKIVDALYFYDDEDSIYVGIEGKLELSDDDGIGIMLNFDERDGKSTGNSLGDVDGASGFFVADEDQFTMDFNVDLGLNFFGVSGNRAALSVADYTEETPQGFQVVTDSDAAEDGGDKVSGPVTGDEIFPDESVTYAFDNSGDDFRGYEVRISKDALNIDGGEVQGFAFITSNTAFFSDVTVPGHLTENPGFNPEFHQLEGGPFVSKSLQLGAEDENLATPIPEFPREDDVADSEFEFTWNEIDQADSYAIQAIESDDDFDSGPFVIDEEVTDNNYEFSADESLRGEELSWRVRSQDAEQNSLWSGEVNFTIQSQFITYLGNQNSGFGGPVGQSQMSISDDEGSVTIEFEKGEGDFNDAMVIYIATGSDGRSVIDGEINDQDDALRRAISSAGENQSEIKFPRGFNATHAIAVDENFGGLWSIPTTGEITDADLNFITGVGSPDNPQSDSFTLNFEWDDIETNGNNEFDFVVTYLNSGNGFTSDEVYGSGIEEGNPGSADLTFTNYYSYPATSSENRFVEQLFEGDSEEDNSGWRMLASPVDGAVIEQLERQNMIQGDFTGSPFASGELNIYTGYNQEWIAPENIENELTRGHGFIWYLFDNDEESSVSLPFELAISGDATPRDTEVTLHDDWNLLGNPFDEDLDVSDIQSWADGDLESAVAQVWDPEEGDEGSYITVNDNIAPFQGFFINNDDANQLTIPESAAGGDDAQFYRETSDSDYRLISLMFEGKNDLTGQTLVDRSATVYFHPEADTAWDIRDAKKLRPLSTSYVTMGFIGSLDDKSVEQSQISLPFDLSEEIRIPVNTGSSDNVAGTFRIEAHAIENLPEDWTVKLRDEANQKSVNLAEEEMLVELNNATDAGNQSKSWSEAITQTRRIASLLEDQDFATSSDKLYLMIYPPGNDPNEAGPEIPQELSLSQNYPNPFNPITQIEYGLPEEADVTLTVYDIMGRQVKTLVDQQQQPGRYEVSLDGSGLASGNYIYRLRAGNESITKTMTLIK